MATTLSVIVPVFNEADLIGPTIDRVLAVDFGMEVQIIVVDDGSTDGSDQVIQAMARAYPGKIAVLTHTRNRGKGAAIRTALESATGSIAVIQDSDLEYDPRDLPSVLRPLLEGRADAVFGSRFVVSGERRVLYFWHSVANGVLAFLVNVFADLNLTDPQTGYKAFRVSLARSIPLRSEGFDIEPELTMKLAQRGAALYEVPISYYGRTYADGKKIGFGDFLKEIRAIVRYGLTRDIYMDKGARILDALAQTPRFNRWMADTVRPFLGPTVLEIGAGIGNLATNLCPRRKLYFATDLDPEHLSRLRVRFGNRPNVRLKTCDLMNPADFRDIPAVDSVVCLNVLEHVEDDAQGLRNIHDALLPGGRAVVLVPQDQNAYGTLDKVLGHFRRYSEEELRSKMQAAGFEVERVLHFNRATRPGWILNGRVLKLEHFSRLQLWIFDRMVWLWKPLERVLPWASTSIIAIARKPG